MKEKLNDERNHLLKSKEDLLEGPMIFLVGVGGFIWLILLVVEFYMGPPHRSAIFEHYHLSYFHYRFLRENFSCSQEN